MNSFVFNTLGPIFGLALVSILTTSLAFARAGDDPKKDKSCVINCGLDESGLKTTSNEMDELIEVGSSLIAPTPNDIKFLCMHTTSKATTGKESPVYKYEEILWKLSGVTEQEKKEDETNAKIRASKVKAYWGLHGSKFVCDAQKLTQEENGFIMKYAISEVFSDMIDNLVETYNVDLNIIDSNGTTVMDFILEQKKIYEKSPEMLDWLDNYYNVFKNAGALHAAEIKKKNIK